MSISAPLAENARARLVATAGVEIRLIGPRRMTVLSVAGKLGMSHANVYRYFADKTALIDAVLNAWLRGFETRLTEIADGPDPADDKLERFLTTLSRGYVETLRQDVALFRLLAQPETGMQEPERHRRRVVDLAGRIIEEGLATRLFGGGDMRRALTLTLDLAYRFIDPASVLAADQGAPASDARRDRTIRSVIRAVAAQR